MDIDCDEMRGSESEIGVEEISQGDKLLKWLKKCE